MPSEKEIEEKRLRGMEEEEIKQSWYANYLRECEEKGLPIKAVAVPDVDECIRQLSTEVQEENIKGEKEAEARAEKERLWAENEKSKQARKKQLEAEQAEKKESKK